MFDTAGVRLFRATTKDVRPWCEVASKTPYRRPLLDEIPKKAPWQTCAHRHFNGDKVALEPRCDVLGLGLRHQLRRGGRKRVLLGLELTSRQTGISGSRERSVLNLEFPKASTEPMMTGAIRLPVSWHRLETARWTPCMWCGTLIRCADRGGIIISRCCTHTRMHSHTHTHSHIHTALTRIPHMVLAPELAGSWCPDWQVVSSVGDFYDRSLSSWPPNPARAQCAPEQELQM